MRFVTIKTIQQQDLQALHRLRQLLVHQRTAIINQVRGVLAERGIVVAQSPAAFHRAMPEILASSLDELSQFCRGMIVELLEHLTSLEERIGSCDARVKTVMASSEACKRISAIDGVGPLTATAIVAAVGDASEFKNGRHLAAWLGLVPRQYSSGGKSKLYGISKRGDTYLRTLLIHGARSMLRYVRRSRDCPARRRSRQSPSTRRRRADRWQPLRPRTTSSYFVDAGVTSQRRQATLVGAASVKLDKA